MEPSLPPLLQEIFEQSENQSTAKSLFIEALTHKTFVNERANRTIRDNQRLEFMGDAVLELIVTQTLFETLPHADEGLLSRARASVVNEAALAEAARELSLAPYLRLGRGEETNGGRQRPRILADAFEAVIAAAYLVGGLEAASKLVHKSLRSAIDVTVQKSAPLHNTEVLVDARVKDPKSVLQELSQRQKLPVPMYEIEDTQGAGHERIFYVRVLIQGQVLGHGSGRSRRDAEMQAAEIALQNISMLPKVGEP